MPTRLRPIAILAIILVGCQHSRDLNGQPSWLPIGPEVYQERDHAQAEREVLSVRREPRWFHGYGREVTTEEFQQYLDGLRKRGTKFTFEEQMGGKHYLPDPPPYPASIGDLPLEDQGARLSLSAAGCDDQVVRLELALTASRRPICREVEHRCTNALPMLFAFYLDGQAIQVALGPWGREGGANYLIPLVEKGGARTWSLRVDQASLTALLSDPKQKPHRLAIIAAFSELQHEPHCDDESSRFFGTSLPRPAEPQILVRSQPIWLDWTGSQWRMAP